MKTKTSKDTREEAISLCDEILGVDYHKMVRKEERGNPWFIGILSKLNTVYFDQYLKTEWEVKEGYKEEFDKVKSDFERQLNNISSEQ